MITKRFDQCLKLTMLLGGLIKLGFGYMGNLRGTLNPPTVARSLNTYINVNKYPAIDIYIYIFTAYLNPFKRNGISLS